MIVKIFGFLDLFVGISFVIYGFFGLFPYSFIFLLGLILLIKGITFSIDFNVINILDIISALIILMSFFGMPKIIVFLVMVFLVQKGVFSLIG